VSAVEVFMTIPVRYDGRHGSEPHPLGADITDRDYIAVIVDIEALDEPDRWEIETAVRILANERFPLGWYTTYAPGPDWDRVRERYTDGRAVEVRLVATTNGDEIVLADAGTVAS
jgi:hypothetical protein